MRYAVALTVCSLVVAFGVFPFPSRELTESGLEQDIRNHGAVRAYADLVKYEEGRPSTEQHAAGHMFGRVLYRTIGIEGVSTCDGSLLYGCVHEFIARAIVADGFDVLPRLASECKYPNRSTGCYHGIGHGLIVYLGYAKENLAKALDECKSYQETEPTQGCFGGVFMEMNLRTMSREAPLEYSEKDTRGVCDDVAETFRRACIFWLPQWWRDSHLSDRARDDLYKELGRLCSVSVKNETERRSCFGGIGYIASPSVEFDAERSREVCRMVSTSSKEQEYCWDVASQSVIRASDG
jgi:hypothetical protein